MADRHDHPNDLLDNDAMETHLINAHGWSERAFVILDFLLNDYTKTPEVYTAMIHAAHQYLTDRLAEG